MALEMQECKCDICTLACSAADRPAVHVDCLNYVIKTGVRLKYCHVFVNEMDFD